MAALLSRARRRFDRRTRVQTLSDLHLEVGQQYATFTFPVSAPFLLLGGDIGRLVDYDAFPGFPTTQVARYKRVFLVLGNHEFYSLSHDAGLATGRRLAAEPSLASKVVLMHRQRWDDPDSDLTILGCTLWSAIPEGAYGAVASKVSDFKKTNEWTPHQHSTVHAEEAAWLREQVSQLRQADAADRKRRLLIATHHAPCIEGTSRPEHVNNPWTPAFATDLIVDKGAWDGVRVWVFGHTHYSTRFVRHGIKLVANQRGYVLPGYTGEREDVTGKKGGSYFDPGLAIAV